MKWDKILEKKVDTKTKLPLNRYIFAVPIILLLIAAALVFIYFTQDQRSDPASKRIIREAAAVRLGKNHNELSDEQVEELKKALPNSKIYNFK